MLMEQVWHSSKLALSESKRKYDFRKCLLFPCLDANDILSIRLSKTPVSFGESSGKAGERKGMSTRYSHFIDFNPLYLRMTDTEKVRSSNLLVRHTEFGHMPLPSPSVPSDFRESVIGFSGDTWTNKSKKLQWGEERKRKKPLYIFFRNRSPERRVRWDNFVLFSLHATVAQPTWPFVNMGPIITPEINFLKVSWDFWWQEKTVGIHKSQYHLLKSLFINIIKNFQELFCIKKKKS